LSEHFSIKDESSLYDALTTMWRACLKMGMPPADMTFAINDACTTVLAVYCNDPVDYFDTVVPIAREMLTEKIGKLKEYRSDVN